MPDSAKQGATPKKQESFLGNLMKYSVATYLGFLISGAALVVKGILPPDSYAVPAAFMAYTTSLMNVGMLGLDQGLLRFYHEPPEGATGRTMFAACTRLSLLVMAAVGLVGSVFFIFFGLIFYILHMRSYSNRQLFTTAFVDQLTGADNFNRMCEQFPEKLAGLNGKAALVIFDINKFKVINDLHGYERGNQVLQRVARVLRENLSPEESFCRSTADKRSPGFTDSSRAAPWAWS